MPCLCPHKFHQTIPKFQVLVHLLSTLHSIRQCKLIFLNIFFSPNLNFEIRMSILPLMIVTLSKCFWLRVAPNPNKMKYFGNLNGIRLIIAFFELYSTYFFCSRLLNWCFFEPIFTVFYVRSKINLTFHDDYL